MTAPLKFDFSSYHAAIRAIPAIREREDSQNSAVDPCYSCDSAIPSKPEPVPNSRIAGIAEAKDDFQDDRHHCRECRNYRNGYCTVQRFRPVDDMPRRCDDFTGYPDRIGQSASNAKPAPDAPPADPLLVEVWTPSGTPLMTRADNADHADWLRKMNPKPASPAPKPPVPEPDAERTDEAAHNAAGRFFKFLATWEDGSQCYLCQMPRQTIDEMRTQYPTATHIEPVLNEEYP